MKPSALLSTTILSLGFAATLVGQPASGNGAAIEEETLRHFQAILRVDSTAKEEGVARYLEEVLTREGIPAQVLTTEPGRPNVVARLKGPAQGRLPLDQPHGRRPDRPQRGGEEDGARR